MYKKIDIWKKTNDDLLTIYVCFQDIESELFYVQSRDFVYFPIEESTLKQHNKQIFDLFLSEEPKVRADGFESLEDAISDFDLKFD